MSFTKQALQHPSIRWIGSFTLVVGIYASAVLFALNWPASSTLLSPPTAAILVELTPIPTAPEAPLHIAPPGPVQEETPPEPLPEPEPEIELLPEIPMREEAKVVLPPKPEPREKEPEPIEEIIEQEERAPPSVIAQPDAIAAAPRDGAVSLTPSRSPITWQSALLSHLEKHKRYPRRARRRGYEAVVYVRVTLNRDGTVVNYKLTQPCAYASLNRETLALINRAQPLPPPPKEVSGETVEFVVPIAFSLKS